VYGSFVSTSPGIAWNERAYAISERGCSSEVGRVGYFHGSLQAVAADPKGCASNALTVQKAYLWNVSRLQLDARAPAPGSRAA
jgi:hypothetical protein